MGTQNSCARPPESAQWSLPNPTTEDAAWDRDPQGWGIPIYGLSFLIANKNPKMRVASTAISPSGQWCSTTAVWGSCTADTCNPLVKQQCPSCKPNEVATSYIITGKRGTGGSCSTGGSCTETYNTQCTIRCSLPDSVESCPRGTSVGIDPKALRIYTDAINAGKPMATAPKVICEYRPHSGSTDKTPGGITITELVKLGFPDQWTSKVIARYAIYEFASALNREIYGNETTTFHQTYDFTDPQGLESFVYEVISRANIQNIISYSPAYRADARYLEGFTKMLVHLAQMHYLTVERGERGGDRFGMLFYSLGTIDGNAPGTHHQPHAQDMTTYMQRFTTETVENSASLSTIPQVGAPSNTFIYPPTIDDLLNNNHYIFVDLNGGRVYNIGVSRANLQSINAARKATPAGDFYIVGRIFNIVIERISPVIGYWYSRKIVNLEGSTKICDRIFSDSSMMPSLCYRSRCGPGNHFTDSCKAMMIHACSGKNAFIPHNIFPSLSFAMNLFYMTEGSEECSCYNTRLRPVITGESQRLPGMCFTGACSANPELMKSFGLTDEVCAKYCPQVYTWLTDPQRGSQSRDYIDTQRYKRICGQSYVPNTETKINRPVLIGGIVTTIMITIGVWIIDRPRATIGNTVIIGTVLMAITVFTALFLNGRPGCNPNIFYRDPWCTSNFLADLFPGTIPVIKIPNLFCPQPIACECVVDGQCPPGRVCLTGICAPKGRD